VAALSRAQISYGAEGASRPGDLPLTQVLLGNAVSAKGAVHIQPGAERGEAPGIGSRLCSKALKELPDGVAMGRSFRALLNFGHRDLGLRPRLNMARAVGAEPLGGEKAWRPQPPLPRPGSGIWGPADARPLT